MSLVTVELLQQRMITRILDSGCSTVARGRRKMESVCICIFSLWFFVVNLNDAFLFPVGKSRASSRILLRPPLRFNIVYRGKWIEERCCFLQSSRNQHARSCRRSLHG